MGSSHQRTVNIINEQRKEIIGKPKNLEEQAISLVGRDIYEKTYQGLYRKAVGEKNAKYSAFYY